MLIVRKIFLVDDEMAIRDGIGKSINWENEGFIYCGDASDGELALPLIEKHRPDIVITDIQMPFMNGLELSHILREKFPSIKIIILSGHDEFEYAREAMRIQVSEYCLKPVSSQDLLTILQKASAQIDQEEKNEQRLLHLEYQVIQNQQANRDQFLYELCEGLYSFSDAMKKATKLNIPLISEYYYIIISECSLDSTIDWIPRNYSCIRFSRKIRESIFIMLGNSKQQLEQEANSIRKELNEHSKHIELLFGIGRVESRIQGISLSFTEAEEEKNNAKIIQKYRTEDMNKTLESHIDCKQMNRMQLLEFLKTGKVDDINHFSSNYSAFLNSDNIRSQLTIYYFIMDFTITVTHYLKDEESISDNPEIIQKVSHLEHKASWVRNYTDVLNYMENMLKLVLSIRKNKAISYTQTIQLTVNYIQSHYHNSQLSLQTVSDAVNISASYLSHLFSQETGTTLIEYLTNIRIEKAKELLLKTHNKTYEIATQVGYSDSHYFCRTFKKVTGLTTRQYKNQAQKEFFEYVEDTP